MSVRPLRAFISSKMQELVGERQAIKAALADMHVEAFVFEDDAGARPQTIEDTFLEEVESADLYIGLFWIGYGPYTIQEYERASALGMDCLIYEKREAVDDRRDPQLAAFLETLGKVETGLTIKWFHTPAELGTLVKEDVARWQAQKVRESEAPRGARLFAGIPRVPPHFDGRDEPLLRAIRSLRAGHDVSVTGLPGVGKTTFAAALARNKGILRHFRDGILWGSVGPAGDTGRVLSAWLAALGASVGGSATPGSLSDGVREAIADRSVLIVIDDVWQPETIKRLQVSGPNCAVLLTTRDQAIARSLSPENLVELLPLAEDPAFVLLGRLAPEACQADDARARAIAGSAGGLPLAIELIGGFLAAPENSTFSELRELAFDQIADPAQRLQLAFSRLGSVDGRDVSLQETVMLGLTGLPQASVEAFNRLGAFAPKPATFGLDAAKAVTGVDARHLALLVARHLLTNVGNDRLEIHQVLADAANAPPGPERNACRLVHGRYYGALVSNALRDYAQNNEGRTPGAATAIYRREQQQIDAAIAWLMTHPASGETDNALVDLAQARQFMVVAAFYDDDEQAGMRRAALDAAGRVGRQDAKARLQLAESMHARTRSQFAEMRGQWQEAVRLCESALEIAAGVADLSPNWSDLLPGTLGRSYGELLGASHTFELLNKLSTLHRRLNQPAQALRYGERALALARGADRKDLECTALGELAGLYGNAGQNEPALEALERRLELLAEISGKPADRAETLGNLGVFAFRLDRREEAARYLEQALRAAEELGESGIVRASVSLLATLSEQAGKFDEAIAYLVHQRKIVHLEARREETQGKSQAQALAQFFGEAKVNEWRARVYELCKEEARILDRLGRLFRDRPEPNLPAAIQAFTGAHDVSDDLNDPASAGLAMANLGDTHARAKDTAKAIDSYEKALPKLAAGKNWHGFFLATTRVTNILVNQGDYAKAVERLESAEKTAADIGDIGERLEAIDRLGSAHAIWFQKSTGSMDKAIACFERGLDLATQAHNEEKRAMFAAQLLKARFQSALASRRQDR